ncbi:Xylosyltransferase 2 [Sparganum proliferum]
MTIPNFFLRLSRGTLNLCSRRKKLVFLSILALTVVNISLLRLFDERLESCPPFSASTAPKSCQELITSQRHDTSFLRLHHMTNSCPLQAGMNKPPTWLGCFTHNPTKPPLSVVRYTSPQNNSPAFCVASCRSAGFAYAGLQGGVHCWCDRVLPSSPPLTAEHCHLPCPNTSPLEAAERPSCGAELAVDVYSTGAVERIYKTLTSRTVSPWQLDEMNDVRVVYVLVLTGRSWRHIQRSFRLLYHSSNYYYVHVDKKSEYLYSRFQKVAHLLPNNVYVTPTRRNPVWGAPELLSLMLSIMRDLLVNFPSWKWDFLINLSETDIPIAPNADLIRILNEHRGQILLKATDAAKHEFIKSQGLGKAFFQCDDYVWLLRDRQPMDGIVIHGGSDWLILPRYFCAYAALPEQQESLVRNLVAWYANVILPVESFFHTLAYNSAFCELVVNSNLRFVNWQRPRGCSCRLNQTADWCGCSPSVFSGPRDIYRLHKARLLHSSAPTSPQLQLFARKFDSTIDVAMVNYVEVHLLGRGLPDSPNSNLFLESIYSSQYDHQSEDNLAVPAALLGFRFLATAATEFARTLDKCIDSYVPNTSHPDVFALFNASAAILDYVNYTQLHEQLEKYSFLSTNQLSAALALRPTIGKPALVLRIALSPIGPLAEEGRNVLEVLFQRRLQSWVSDRPPNLMNFGDILYFEVGAGFDTKELVFRNYHGFYGSRDRLSLMVIWCARRARGAQPASLPPPLPPVDFRLVTPTGQVCDSATLRVSRNLTTREFFYPGLPDFHVAFQHLEWDALRSCISAVAAAETTLFGTWRVEEISIPQQPPRTANFTIFPDSLQAASLPSHKLTEVFQLGTQRPVEACLHQCSPRYQGSAAAGCSCKLELCQKSAVWSTLFPDEKSALGYFDSSSGLLKVDHASLLDGPMPPVYSVGI